jgi:lysine/ornithine N-monooxygenase
MGSDAVHDVHDIVGIGFGPSNLALSRSTTRTSAPAAV